MNRIYTKPAWKRVKINWSLTSISKSRKPTRITTKKTNSLLRDVEGRAKNKNQVSNWQESKVVSRSRRLKPPRTPSTVMKKCSIVLNFKWNASRKVHGLRRSAKRWTSSSIVLFPRRCAWSKRRRGAKPQRPLPLDQPCMGCTGNLWNRWVSEAQRQNPRRQRSQRCCWKLGKRFNTAPENHR